MSLIGERTSAQRDRLVVVHVNCVCRVECRRTSVAEIEREKCRVNFIFANQKARLQGRRIVGSQPFIAQGGRTTKAGSTRLIPSHDSGPIAALETCAAPPWPYELKLVLRVTARTAESVEDDSDLQPYL